MNVFLAGATGVIGKRAVARLLAAGHRVTAVARSADKAEWLRAQGATPVGVSLFDRDALAAAVAGHDAVVNLATSIPPPARAVLPSSWNENDRIRTEGAANLVDAALAAGATRYVQESITFTYEDGGDRWIDAETATTDSGVSLSAVDAAEASAARFGDAVVLRFGMFYAPDSTHTIDMLAAARRGVAAVVGPAGAYQSMIHADDAADAVVAALDAPPGTYDVVDDRPVTRAELADALAAAVGRSTRLSFPGGLARLGGARVEPLARSQRVSNRRFREVTGWRPSSPDVATGLPAVAAQMAQPPARPLAVRLVRPVLMVLAGSAVQLGAWATLAPRSFYDDFPGAGRQWVAGDGPYNEHLVRDFGGLQLALAALLVAAVLRPDRFLVRTAALASALFAVPHFAYHLRHLDVYSTSDKVANVVLLANAVLLPMVLLLGTTRPRPGEGSAGTVPGSWARSESSSQPVSAPSQA